MYDDVFPDLKLRSFIAFMRSGAVTEAARRVGRTQPAVTQQLASLEEDFGVTLLERKGRGLAPTAAGEVLFKYAERIEALYREAAAATAEASGREDYVVGATLSLAEFLLPEIIATLQKEKPGLEIRMRAANTSVVAAEVRRGELALGLVEGPFDPEGLEAESFGRDRLLLVAAPGSDLGARAPIPAARLLELPLLERERGSGTRAVFEAWLAGRGLDPEALVPRMELGSIGAIKSLVGRGIGFAVLSELAVSAELAAGSLEAIPLEGGAIERDLVLLRPASIGGMRGGGFGERLAGAARAALLRSRAPS